MKIELKKIEYSERLSQETNAFAADLYIEGKKVGIASNEGHGGPTDYHATNETGRQLIKEAEAYCKGLPPIEYSTFTVAMDLEHFIDRLLEDHLRQKALQHFNNKLDRHMKDHIVFGIPNQSFTMLRLKFPVDMILVLPAGNNIMRDMIEKKILPELKDGIILLNTNIPENILQQAGLTPDQFVKQDINGTKKIKAVKKNPRPRM